MWQPRRSLRISRVLLRRDLCQQRDGPDMRRQLSPGRGLRERLLRGSHVWRKRLRSRIPLRSARSMRDLRQLLNEQCHFGHQSILRLRTRRERREYRRSLCDARMPCRRLQSVRERNSLVRGLGSGRAIVRQLLCGERNLQQWRSGATGRSVHEFVPVAAPSFDRVDHGLCR